MPDSGSTRKGGEAVEQDQGLSDLRPKDVLAILCGDLHLQEKTPIARAEEDWFSVMGSRLSEIRQLQMTYKAPVIFPGDVFDKWNSSPFVINWAIDKFSTFPPIVGTGSAFDRMIYAVGGNHDLPLHNLEDVRKSAYWTLTRIGSINHLKSSLAHGSTVVPLVEGPGLGYKVRPYLHLWGFSHGEKYEDARVRKHDRDKEFHLAVIHDYCWSSDHSHPGAPKEKHAKEHSERLGKCGFDAAVFGDNHKGFCPTVDYGCPLINPGTMLCRTTDERRYQPMVGLLTLKGIKPYYLDTSRDKWSDRPEKEEVDKEETAEFLRELAKLGDAGLDFSDRVRRFMAKHKTPVSVKSLIQSFMEGK